MSSDDGFVIRQNAEDKYVLQWYCASANDYPPINEEALVFDTLEEAVRRYAEIDSGPYYSEYGLSIRIKPKELPSGEADEEVQEEAGRDRSR